MYVINHLFAFATAVVLLMTIYSGIRAWGASEVYLTKSFQRGFVISGTFIIVALQWLAVALNFSKGLY